MDSSALQSDDLTPLLATIEQALGAERAQMQTAEAWAAALERELVESLAHTFGGGLAAATAEVARELAERPAEGRLEHLEQMVLMTRFLSQSGDLPDLRRAVRPQGDAAPAG